MCAFARVTGEEHESFLSLRILFRPHVVVDVALAIPIALLRGVGVQPEQHLVRQRLEDWEVREIVIFDHVPKTRHAYRRCVLPQIEFDEAVSNGDRGFA